MGDDDWKKEMEEFVNGMSDEEFEIFLQETGYYDKRTCEPETCHGECQGGGSCQLCVDFRKEMGIRLPTLDEIIHGIDKNLERNPPPIPKLADSPAADPAEIRRRALLHED